MKTKTLILSITLLGTGIFSSCTQELDEQPAGNAGKEANFNIGILPLTRTSTTGLLTSFVENDEIGIFEGTNTVNTKYTLGSNNTWTGNQIFFPKDGAANFFAYYPWVDSVTDDGNLTHTVDTNQSNGYNSSDLLLSKGTISGQSTTVELQFKHTLALVEVDATALTDITITGVAIKAIAESTVNLTTQSVAVNTSAGVQTISMNKYGSDAKYRAVVPAQTLAAGKKIIISTAETNYTCSITEATLVAANINKFTLKDGAVTAVFTMGNIDDWKENGNSYDVNMPENGNLLTMTDDDLTEGAVTVKDKTLATGWYFNWYNADGKESTCKVVKVSEHHYVNVYLKAQSNGNFDSYWEKECGYTQFGTFKKGVYTLKFKAKHIDSSNSSATAKLGIYCQAPVNTGSKVETKFMLINQYPYSSGWYNGNSTKDITTEEQECTVDFDLAYFAAGPYGFQTSPTAITNETLARIHLGFYNATKEASYKEFYIHDLQFFYKGESQGLKP